MNSSKIIAALMIIIGTLLIGAYVLLNRQETAVYETAVSTPILTATPEPIIPTRPPTQGIDSTPSTSSTAEPIIPTVTPAIARPPLELARVGVSGSHSQVIPALAAGLQFGAHLSWNTQPNLPDVDGVQFLQMVRLSETGMRSTTWEAIEETAVSHPNSIWIIGNEPDVVWQDNVTAPAYAHWYHETYQFIKSYDPTAQIAIAGVAEPTPLRLAYLDAVLDAYQAEFGEPMPIDVWTIHLFILREEADSWGVGVPPGMTGELGRLYELEDHADVAIVEEFMRDMRRWMAARGYGERPLIVTEFGILMPADYGFSDEVVDRYMGETLDLFNTLRGEDGLASDDGRLVQQWFWYILHDGDQYPRGNLYDPATGKLTAVGEMYATHIRNGLLP
jgi:hypothetical protein